MKRGDLFYMTNKRCSLNDAKGAIDDFLLEHSICDEGTFFSIFRILTEYRVLSYVCDLGDIPYQTITVYRHGDRRERTELLVRLLNTLGYDLKVVRRD